MKIVSQEIMKYKANKKVNQSLTKLRIIRQVLVDKQTRQVVSLNFCCHRNTISNLISLFDKNISVENKEKLLISKNLNIDQIDKLMSPLLDKSSKPHSHPLQAPKQVEDEIVRIFEHENMKIGAERMRNILSLRFNHSKKICQKAFTANNIDKLDKQIVLQAQIAMLSLAKFKGIYKRRKLKPPRIKMRNGTRKELYDYQALGVFEQLHFDTKVIADGKSLPKHIYDGFKKNKGKIPAYQWTLMDAKSKFRLVAYSIGINSEFGLRFLLFSLSYIRTYTNNLEAPIHIGLDNGIENCGRSLKKLAYWNSLLSTLNAKATPYNPHFDIKKNIIERSHRSDDNELLIAHGAKMTSINSFLHYARDYIHYWNNNRVHSGKGANNRTPVQVLKDAKIMGIDQLVNFPVLLLEESINDLRVATAPLFFNYQMQQEMKKVKTLKPEIDMVDNALNRSFYFQQNAQKVLTYYHVMVYLFR